MINVHRKVTKYKLVMMYNMKNNWFGLVAKVANHTVLTDLI